MAGGHGWASASWAGVPLRALRRAWERERVPAERGSERGAAPPLPPQPPPPALPRGGGWALAVFGCCVSGREEGAQAPPRGGFQQRMRAASSSNLLGSLFGTPSARRQGSRAGKVERRSSVTGEVEIVDVVTFKYDTAAAPGGARKKAIVTLAAPAAAAGGGQGARRREEERSAEEVGGEGGRGGGEGGEESQGAKGEFPQESGDEFHECLDELFEHPEELETHE